jgi:hypothetical protein
MRLLWLLALVAPMVVPGEAAACPPGPCSKYQLRVPHPTEAVVNTYRRTIRATPPRSFDHRQLATFLATSSWDPVILELTEDALPPRTLRLVQPHRAIRAPHPTDRTADRSVLLREITRRKGTTYVAVDGQYFALIRCADDKQRATSCLKRVDELPEAEAEVIRPKQRFATPP